MSRFFKSAAFPILIVVVLAFFAQKLISPGTQARQNTYADFVNQLQAGQMSVASGRQFLPNGSFRFAEAIADRSIAECHFLPHHDYVGQSLH